MAGNASAPQNTPKPVIAGSVLPLQRAEELLLTLPGVVSARIVAAESGAIDAIHLLACADTPPKQMVRNVESALIAQLGLRVDHRKISVATTMDRPRATGIATPPAGQVAVAEAVEPPLPQRLFFEDIEVRRSRVKGMSCRVTLRRDGQSYTGESSGPESTRARVDLAAEATLNAIGAAAGGELGFELFGCKRLEAFEREFVFVGVTAHQDRDATLLTGSCEIRDSVEAATVMAVLDATNRMVSRGR